VGFVVSTRIASLHIVGSYDSLYFVICLASGVLKPPFVSYGAFTALHEQASAAAQYATEANVTEPPAVYVPSALGRLSVCVCVTE
jgi:hypothetical protein